MARFRVVGYYFRSKVKDCLRRNESRSAAQRIPVGGILMMHKRLELPALAEGFDIVWYLRIADDNAFVDEEWPDEVRCA